jgi:hypothetical protein
VQEVAQLSLHRRVGASRGDALPESLRTRVDSLVLEERTQQQLVGGVVLIDDERKEPLFLLPEVLNRVGGVEREKPLDRVQSNGLAVVRRLHQPSRLDKRVVVVVRKRDESGMSLHRTTVTLTAGNPQERR